MLTSKPIWAAGSSTGGSHPTTRGYSGFYLPQNKVEYLHDWTKSSLWTTQHTVGVPYQDSSFFICAACSQENTLWTHCPGRPVQPSSIFRSSTQLPGYVIDFYGGHWQGVGMAIKNNRLVE